MQPGGCYVERFIRQNVKAPDAADHIPSTFTLDGLRNSHEDRYLQPHTSGKPVVSERLTVPLILSWNADAQFCWRSASARFASAARGS